jgi:Domain of unknown function (DUF4457)
VLPHAVALSKIRVWNYVRSVERGACEVDILLDDHLIYSGFFAKAGAPGVHQTILFTNVPAEIAAEKAYVAYNIAELEKGHLTLIDEKRVRNKGHTFREKRRTGIERPSTAVVS